VRALVISAGAFHDTHQSTVLVRAVSRAVPDELYVTEKVWPGVRPLATPVDYRDQREYPVVWVHESQGVRVFGTTLGPDVATWDHPDSQALLVRGFRWAINRN
jgi:type 1 glutamine amidotransferase